MYVCICTCICICIYIYININNDNSNTNISLLLLLLAGAVRGLSQRRAEHITYGSLRSLEARYIRAYLLYILQAIIDNMCNCLKQL